MPLPNLKRSDFSGFPYPPRETVSLPPRYDEYRMSRSVPTGPFSARNAGTFGQALERFGSSAGHAADALSELIAQYKEAERTKAAHQAMTGERVLPVEWQIRPKHLVDIRFENPFLPPEYAEAIRRIQSHIQSKVTDMSREIYCTHPTITIPDTASAQTPAPVTASERPTKVLTFDDFDAATAACRGAAAIGLHYTERTEERTSTGQT